MGSTMPAFPDAGEIRYKEMESPIGPLTLCAVDGKLCRIGFGRMAEGGGGLIAWAARAGLAGEFRPSPDEPVLAEAAAQLGAYFRGERFGFDVPTMMYGTSFQRAVWRALGGIPYAEVRTYREVAESVGRPKAVRAVGGANNRNPLPIIVPCHRVIGADGALVGYRGGLKVKSFLLELERSRSGGDVARSWRNVLS